MCDILKIDLLIKIMSITATGKQGDAVTAPHHRNQQINKKGVKLIGKPCSGKSVVAKRFVKQYGATHYSSSAALRQYASQHDRTDILYQMDNGDLVTDMDVVRLVSGWHFQDFEAHRTLGIFDGWGRIDKELKFGLERLMRINGDLQVVFLDGETDALRERARQRGRGDDGVLLKRINCYCEFFDRLIDISRIKLGENRVHLIDTTSLTEDEVFDATCRHVKLAH